MTAKEIFYFTMGLIGIHIHVTLKYFQKVFVYKFESTSWTVVECYEK